MNNLCPFYHGLCIFRCVLIGPWIGRRWACFFMLMTRNVTSVIASHNQIVTSGLAGVDHHMIGWMAWSMDRMAMLPRLLSQKSTAVCGLDCVFET